MGVGEVGVGEEGVGEVGVGALFSSIFEQKDSG